MSEQKHCLFCGCPSGRSKFCRDCREKNRKYGAVISQNITKLTRLLQKTRRDSEWFEKFILYASNIINNGKLLLEFRVCDNLRNHILVQNYTM